MEKHLVEKLRNMEVRTFCDIVTNWSTFAVFKTHTLDKFSPSLHLETSLVNNQCTHVHVSKFCTH